MITVKLYGLLRLNSGIKELQIEATSIKHLLHQLEERGFEKSDLTGANILVNGTLSNHRTALQDGDTVQLFPPVAGG